MPRRVMVLDTTAMLAALPLQLSGVELYTTPSVVEEVKDAESRQRLETALALGRVRVVRPPPRAVDEVLRASVEVGEHGSLSRTDVEVAALALALARRGLDVTVVTDDYALQNLVAHLGIPFQPLRTRGIQRVSTYVYACPACGYRSTRPGERLCPVCGTRLVKKRVR